MPSILVFTHYRTAGGQARQTVIDILTNISAYSAKHKKDCLRYAITLPRDLNDDKSVYALEEYTSLSAFKAHRADPAISDLMAYFPENPSIFTGEADVVISETSSSFIRPEIAAHADPFIATATIGYKEGTRDQAHEGWRTVTTETEKSEPGTLAYYIFKDIANATNAGTFEIYTDETYFRDVHAKSKVVAENRAKYGNEIRTSFKFVLLKLVAGWLRRDEAESTG